MLMLKSFHAPFKRRYGRLRHAQFTGGLRLRHAFFRYPLAQARHQFRAQRGLRGQFSEAHSRSFRTPRNRAELKGSVPRRFAACRFVLQVAGAERSVLLRHRQ